MKLCLFLLFGTLVVICRSAPDLLEEFRSKQYIVDALDLERVMNNVKNRVFLIHQPTSRYQLWVEELSTIFSQTGRLINAFSGIVYCDFNKIYMENLIEFIIESIKLDKEDVYLLVSLPRIPEQLTENCGIKLDHTFMQLHSAWEQIAINGGKNFDNLSPELRQQFFEKLNDIKRRIRHANMHVRSMPVNVIKDLNAFLKRTVVIKDIVLQMINILRFPNTVALTKEQIRDKLTTLKGLVLNLNIDDVIKQLKEFTNQVQQLLTIADTCVKNFGKWVQDLVLFEPIYQFSDINEFRVAMSKGKSDIIYKISYAKNKSWVRRLYYHIFPVVDNILDILSVRIVNLSPAYLDGIIALLKQDQKNGKICVEIVKLLEEYKALYKPIALESIVHFIKFDYVQLFKTHVPRITNMREDELNKLDEFLAIKIQNLDENRKNINVTQLQNLYRKGLEKSDDIRTIDLFELKQFYARKDSPQNSQRLKEIKSNLEKNINEAKKLKTDNETAINTEVDKLKETISLCFKDIADLPDKLQQFLNAAPGQGKI